MASFVACVRAIYSASVEDSVTVTWHLLLQLTTPPETRKMYPDVERRESKLLLLKFGVKRVEISDFPAAKTSIKCPKNLQYFRIREAKFGVRWQSAGCEHQQSTSSV